MSHAPVPDFFQEETVAALRSQADWLSQQVGLDDLFFARLLRLEGSAIRNWQTGRLELESGDEDTLRVLWQMTLHLLSLYNFDESRIRDLLTHVLPTTVPGKESSLTPPWRGHTLRAFIEAGGQGALELVDHWVTGLRFSSPHAV